MSAADLSPSTQKILSQFMEQLDVDLAAEKEADAEHKRIDAEPALKAYHNLFATFVNSQWNVYDLIGRKCVEAPEGVKREQVLKVIDVLPNEKIAKEKLSTIARKVTLAQEAIIKQIQSPATDSAGIKQQAQNFMAAMIGNMDTPITRKAKADCQAIFTAMQNGQLRPNATIGDFVAVITGERTGLVASITSAISFAGLVIKKMEQT